MTDKTQDPDLERRRSERYPVDYRALGEHRTMGDLDLHIVNISPNGFMAQGGGALTRGERVSIRLPTVGVIEAHLVWAAGERAGFQFERIIRADEFAVMVELLKAPRTRRDK